MCKVPRQPWHGEEASEELGREPHGAVDQAGEEVDVGVQLPLGEVIVVEGGVHERLRDLDEGVLAGDVKNLVHNLANDLRARVEVLVHPVAKPEELLLLVLDGLQEPGNVLHGSDPLEHPEHGLVGAAVERAVQGSHRAADGGEDVDPGRGEVPAGGGRAVHLVLGVEQEEDVEGLAELGVGPIIDVAVGVQHVQKVLRVGQPLLGLRQLLAGPQVVRRRRDGGGVADDPGDLLVLHDVGLVDAASLERGVGLRVERAQARQPDDQGAHGVGVGRQGGHGLLDSLGNHSVLHHEPLPVVALALVRELAVQNEVGDVQIRGALGELLDGVAPVPQDALKRGKGWR